MEPNAERRKSSGSRTNVLDDVLNAAGSKLAPQGNIAEAGEKIMEQMTKIGSQVVSQAICPGMSDNVLKESMEAMTPQIAAKVANVVSDKVVKEAVIVGSHLASEALKADLGDEILKQTVHVATKLVSHAAEYDTSEHTLQDAPRTVADDDIDVMLKQAAGAGSLLVSQAVNSVSNKVLKQGVTVVNTQKVSEAVLNIANNKSFEQAMMNGSDMASKAVTFDVSDELIQRTATAVGRKLTSQATASGTNDSAFTQAVEFSSRLASQYVNALGTQLASQVLTDPTTAMLEKAGAGLIDNVVHDHADVIEDVVGKSAGTTENRQKYDVVEKETSSRRKSTESSSSAAKHRGKTSHR